MTDVLARFHRTLVEEIRAQRPDYLSGPFTVAEIYQNLAPYGTHRDRIGVEMNGDYEDALLRLLAGEGDYLVLDSEHALRELRDELESSNPNTGLYREYAAVDVRLNRDRLGDAPGGATFAGPPQDEDAGPSVVEAPGAPEAPEADVAEAESPAKLRVTLAGAPAPEAASAEAAAADAADEDGTACRWCRAELPDRETLNFCPFCGTNVDLVPCASCGEELEPEWRFCVACGTEVAV